MAGPSLAQLRRRDTVTDGPRQMIAAERLAVRCKEHREVVRLDGELGPRFGDVLLKPRRRPLSDRHVSVLLAFALANQDQATVQRQVEEFQMDHLQTAQAGCIEHFEDGAVTESDWLLDVGLGHDLLDLVNRYDVP